MRILVSILVLAGLTAGCKESCTDKRKNAYHANMEGLSQTVEVNGINLQMSYFASYMMPNQPEGRALEKDDNDYYYFRLTVQSNTPHQAPSSGSDASIADQSILFYGLDSLFTVGENNIDAIPLLVQPIPKGDLRNLEYLLVFDKQFFDGSEGDEVAIVFNDRLFSQSIQRFVFNKKAISLLETISC